MYVILDGKNLREAVAVWNGWTFGDREGMNNGSTAVKDDVVEKQVMTDA